MTPKKLKILYCGTLPPQMGGSGILSAYMLNGLAERGHSVHAVAPITPEKLENGDAFAEEHPEIKVKRIIVPYFILSPDFLASEKYRNLESDQIEEFLTEIISRMHPDIIIIGRESFAWYVPDIAVAHSIPCILLVQGGTTFGILKNSIPRDKARELLSKFQKTNLIVSVAKHLIESLHQLGLQNVRAIQNTIDAHRFSPRPKDEKLLNIIGIQKDEIVVAHFSNFKKLKRPLDIVHSAKIALQQNKRLKYMIIGDGPMRSEMELACQKTGVSERFFFLGWIDYNSIPDYINLADMVVMPSEAEALALIYLETQACSKLLIASNIPAAREVVSDGETGLLFRKGDIQDMTSKILQAADDPQLREEIGRKARLSMKKYTLADMIDLYEAALWDTVDQFKKQ
jgi:glycosyltransferase involved in cell wall biosynthesis